MTLYSQAFLVKQALPVPGFDVSNYFPVVGDTVSLTNKSIDNDVNLWTIKDGVNTNRTSATLNETVTILAPGGNIQSLKISNTVKSLVESTETVYGLLSPTEPYYTISVSNKVCRVGDSVTITPTRIYPQVIANAHTVKLELYDANTGALYQTINNVVAPVSVNFAYRGAFNIVLTATETSNSRTTVNKQFRIITVTPALALRASAIEFTLKSIETFTIEDPLGTTINTISGTNVPAGSTVVLKFPSSHDPNHRYRIQGLNLKGTLANPIIITIDSTTQMLIKYSSYWGIILQGCEHVVIDGKGYQNIDLGIHVTKHDNYEQGNTAIQITSLSNFIELHNLEVSKPSFAGIFCKTDPDVNNPATLRGNFTMQDTRLHNSYVHDTAGEGMYWGYFDNSEHTKKNSAGVDVTYRPHNLNDTKVYRNRFERTGWDGLQLNNATGATEIHDNVLLDCGKASEPDQNTGMSLGLEGKVFNNYINKVGGAGIQFGALGPVDIYNNVIVNIPEGSAALYLLNSKDVPEQNVGINSNGNFYNNIPINVYNNNLITTGNKATVGAYNVCQHQGFVFRNNVVSCANVSSKFAGQEATTLAVWEANALNNVVLNLLDTTAQKFGSISKGNFNIYSDSSIASGGSVLGEIYDFRGFKNWTDNDKFIGAYSGVVRVSSFFLQLSSIAINSGALLTDATAVNVVMTFLGNPTHYMISESSTFVGASWVGYTSSTVPFTLSSTQGLKTVYVKIKNNNVTTDGVSDTITYQAGRQFLIDFASITVYSKATTYLGAAATWNTFNSPVNLISASSIPVGQSLSNLKDTKNVASTYGLIVTDAFDGVDSNITLPGTQFPYEYNAVRFNWLVSETLGNKGSFNITGLDDTKDYDIILYAHRNALTSTYNFVVKGVAQAFSSRHTDGTGVVDNQAIYNNVKSVGGIIGIDVITTAATRGFLGILDIREKV
ncbi:hypothetical protein [Flavobacterium soyangense]|uniref:Right handed beta helix domain-containing protein n=1 Tax=Flavobacterium soyangense TaxID=2023265 RepID=A0A930XTJ0_9FLAO|nr:hypothetical protein [Flavobacterium soyangense]MBF2707535.1 hypothetical protein [Flavobacterium soyangense]